MRYTNQYPDWTRKEKTEHQAAALELTGGQRGPDGLTDRERQLLQAIQALGLEIVSTPLFPRLIRKSA